MAAADAIVLASDHEGTPTVLVEALAIGTPPVATAVGGIPDLLGDQGTLVAPNDATALANGLRAALAAAPDPAALRARVNGLAQPEIAKSEFEVLQTVIS
jgi:glycosyltransferase involved in cell wall biosynthesis